VLALVIAVALFSRFSIQTTLRRDEAIYAYGGQQLVEGVPFYASIFDAKTPLAATIAGGGVVAGRMLGLDDLTGIRLAFFVVACLSVLAVYLLALWLFGSVPAALVAAATFASFRGFALDALTGPNAKTPGVLFAVVSMALLVRRRYFWGGFAGSLAFLTWQPLAVYVGVAVLVALLAPEGGQRLRLAGAAFAGAAIPTLVTAAHYWVEGGLGDMVDGAFVFPFSHLERKDESVFDRFDRVGMAIADWYPGTGVLIYGGFVALLVLACLRIIRHRRYLSALVTGDPFINVILFSFLLVAAVPAVDFQGYPDLYPLLPYAAIGIGGAFHLVLERLQRARLHAAGRTVAAAAVIALVLASWIGYADFTARSTTAEGLRPQRRSLERIERFLNAGERPYVLGNATSLVLTRLRSSNRYIYLASGVDSWAVGHTPGGIEGWQAEILAEDPPLIVVDGPWRGEIAHEMRSWLRETYRRVRRGELILFLPPATYERAVRRGLVRRHTG
jgi:hypothetical protein